MAGINRLVLSLGSNLGDREAYLKEACEKIRAQIGTIEAISPVYDTPPLGFDAPQSFLNICLICHTEFNPEESLQCIHHIEAQMGRVRVEGTYISRTIDIDIIFYNALIQQEFAPLIPHPSFHQRKFVLLPLNDLDSKMCDPRNGRTIANILSQCTDQSEIHLFKKNLFTLDNIHTD